MSILPTPCDHLGCDREATHYLILRVWSAGDLHTDRNAREAHMPRPLLCKSCAETAKLSDLLTLEVWAFLNAVFLALNKRPPDGEDDIELRIGEGTPPEQPMVPN